MCLNHGINVTCKCHLISLRSETLMPPTSITPAHKDWFQPMSCHIDRCRHIHQEPPSMPSFVELDRLGPGDSQQKPKSRWKQKSSQKTTQIGVSGIPPYPSIYQLCLLANRCIEESSKVKIIWTGWDFTMGLLAWRVHSAQLHTVENEGFPQCFTPDPQPQAVSSPFHLWSYWNTSSVTKWLQDIQFQHNNIATKTKETEAPIWVLWFAWFYLQVTWSAPRKRAMTSTLQSIDDSHQTGHSSTPRVETWIRLKKHVMRF